MNKITLTIIQGLFGTLGFSILFFYGYSSKTAFAFLILLNLPYILRRIVIRESQTVTIKKEHPQMTISTLFSSLAFIFGFLAVVLAVTKLSKGSFQSVVEYKLFLATFYFCFISALIADTSRSPEDINRK